MNLLLAYLHQTNLLELILVGLIINFGIYFCSIGLYMLLSLLPKTETLGEQQEIHSSDIILSLITVLGNTFVFIIGVLLWKYGVIILSLNISSLQLLKEVFIMTVVMDFLMYVFHRAVHLLKQFRGIHALHHTHESTNMFSLFVLHPIECIGFGFMMLGVLYVFSFSAIGISLYLLLNSLWGTIGHLNHTILPKSWLKLAERLHLGTSEFHYLHHQNPDYNFGFYTSFWDALFGTLHLKMKKR